MGQTVTTGGVVRDQFAVTRAASGQHPHADQRRHDPRDAWQFSYDALGRLTVANNTVDNTSMRPSGTTPSATGCRPSAAPSRPATSIPRRRGAPLRADRDRRRRGALRRQRQPPRASGPGSRRGVRQPEPPGRPTAPPPTPTTPRARGSGPARRSSCATCSRSTGATSMALLPPRPRAGGAARPGRRGRLLPRRLDRHGARA
jgi:YD repeat-containing protein